MRLVLDCAGTQVQYALINDTKVGTSRKWARTSSNCDPPKASSPESTALPVVDPSPGECGHSALFARLPWSHTRSCALLRKGCLARLKRRSASIRSWIIRHSSSMESISCWMRSRPRPTGSLSVTAPISASTMTRRENPSRKSKSRRNHPCSPSCRQTLRPRMSKATRSLPPCRGWRLRPKSNGIPPGPQCRAVAAGGGKELTAL